MKRTLGVASLLLAALFVFSFAVAGCQPAPKEEATEEATTEKAAVTEETKEAVSEEVVELVLTSWRADDIEPMKPILAEFHKKYPNITVTFKPITPTEYDSQLRSSLEGGVAADLITLRPYDPGLILYEAGFLESLGGLSGLENFTEVAKGAWTAEDGTLYGVPWFSVLHGFAYNKDIFSELGLSVPQTWDEFIQTLESIKAAGIFPLASGTKEGWTVGVLLFDNVGPSFYGGEPARQALMRGEICFTDPKFVSAFEALEQLRPYLPKDYQALAYYDTQQLFLTGQAAIFPMGSWEVPFFESQNPDFEWGVFAPPVPEGGEPWISNHIDLGVGINKQTKHMEEARTFLEWTTTQEFAWVAAENIGGFYPLSNYKITFPSPHAQEFLGIKEGRGETVRIMYQKLSAQEPSGNTLLWNEAVVGVLNGDMTPEEAAKHVQDGLASWYEPLKACE